MKKIAFLDRDGTLIWEPPESKQIDSLEKLRILPRVIEGLKALQHAGYQLVMVSNQDGLGTASFPKERFAVPQLKLLEILAEQAVEFSEIFICPHRQEDNCDCRKPKLGLVESFLQSNEIDRNVSLMIGDRESDAEFAQNLSVRCVRMIPNSPFPRFAFKQRITRETSITGLVNLDGTGNCRVSTGVGFFDHMLELLVRHSLVDLELEARGDLEVDEHHTVEDCGIVLGEIMRQALGDKHGISRFGFLLPMDEALAEVAIDLSGRFSFVFEAKFMREKLGTLPTEMISHFFRSFAEALGCALHMQLRYGENEHHKCEALFKSLGRCLRQAFDYHPREQRVPSSKGFLS